MSSATVFVSLQHNPPLPFIHVREIKEYETDGIHGDIHQLVFAKLMLVDVHARKGVGPPPLQVPRKVKDNGRRLPNPTISGRGGCCEL